MDKDRKATMIRETPPLRRVLLLVAQSDSRYFMVVDDADRMTGLLSRKDPIGGHGAPAAELEEGGR